MPLRGSIGIVHLLAWLAAFGSAAAQAQSGNAAIYLYEGADRNQRLVENARREGTLSLYTSLAPTESVPLAQAFERKYAVKVQLWRSLSDQVAQRAINEARTRRFTMDVIETNGPVVETVARERVTTRFFSPYIADIPAWGVPPHRLWISDRVDFFVVAFNTDKVQRKDIPVTYEGFLDPRWKGRIAVEATDEEWLAGIVAHWGEKRGMDFFRKLVAMKPDVRRGHVMLSGLVAAGEVQVNLTNYASNADSMKRGKRPIDWKAVEPVVGRPQALGVAANAPHPHAALLFADFVLSPEGQELFNAMDRFPSSRKVRSSLVDFSYVMLDPVVQVDQAEKWQKLWSELVTGQ